MEGEAGFPEAIQQRKKEENPREKALLLRDEGRAERRRRVEDLASGR